MVWQQKLLGDIIQFKNGKKRPAIEGAVPVYGGNGILGYANDFNYNRCIVIGRVGAYCGSVYYEENACWVSDNAIAAQPKNGTDICFAYYLVKSLNLNERHIGTSQPLLTQEILNRIECRVPSLQAQKKIASILSALDDKIALNSKINDNLQRQVFALYDSWFGVFDSTDGVLPREWSEGTLGDIATVTSGKRPPMRQATSTANARIPLVGAASIMGYTNVVLYKEPILITGRVGTHGVIQRFQTPCWASDNTLVIKSNFYEFVYQILQRIDYVNMNRGSTQPLITQTDLKNVKIVRPPDSAICEFEELASALMSMYEANRKENEQLATLRDTMLPKLMSGEIDVSNIRL